MFNVPNFLSFLRIPLAFLFLQENTWVRVFAVIAAMISDGLDGYIARKYNLKTRFGTVLDPIADRVFVIFALVIFLAEGRLTFLDMMAMLCRDFALMIFGMYLIVRKRYGTYEYRSLICGKITTAMQLVVLLGLTLKFQLAFSVYVSFVVLAILALVELYYTRFKPVVE
jgi:CDP-diacylglycerol--glycerol-3-phosphate 3-phosphatidyltransferase